MQLRRVTLKRLSAILAVLLGTLLSYAACKAAASRAGINSHVDKVLILKSQHRLELLSHGQVIRAYQVALGRVPGGKVEAGDHKTPVGLYRVDLKLSKSRFYKALHISYPNATDSAKARKLGVSPGGAIEIHGLPWYFAWLGRAQHVVDWTDGCIAVSDSQMDEIWTLVPVGTPVEIRR